MTVPPAIDDEVCARRPGRPRDERADRAIVQAALELLVEDGYHALSVEAVAARAGVSKTTIYRRWAGKKELLLDALADLNKELPGPPPPGPFRERALQMMAAVCGKDSETLSGRVMPRMMSYRNSQPELYQAYLHRVIEPRRERVRQAVRDGMATGELRDGLDVELTALALTAPLLLMTMTSVNRPSPGRAEAEALLDLLWHGMAAVGQPVAGQLAVS